MDMSPLQQQQVEEDVSLRRGSMEQENKRRMKSQSCRRQSAPSLVITKALTRSKTLSRDSFLVPVSPETCPLVQSFLAASERCFLQHGHAQLRTGMQTQDRHLFLFNDVLVVAKAKSEQHTVQRLHSQRECVCGHTGLPLPVHRSANHFKLKTQVCVSEMWTASCVDEVCEGSIDTERSFVMGWPTCNCVCVYSSAEQKEKWLSLLKSRIKEEKEREEPKTIPLRVYGKGINSFAVTKTLPVSNSDSTNEVIRLALQQFSIIGNVKNYQLWVISKRDNAPYPLIGHEFPFSVHMNHMRQAASQGGGAGARDAVVAAPPVDRDRLQVGHVQASRQCQFILKPRPEESLLQQQQVFADFSQKSFKRRRSLITWAFWRGSASHLNELSVSGAARGCLFGRHLSCVCVEDALPKPVMDMLAFLYHEGPWTRGIFRRPAGARAVRELRDSLDAGEFQLPLTCDHVFVIAGVFKDFLRNIPGSLLCCELHEEWMDVLEEEEEEEEQVQDVQRMICRLPRENALLLRHLLALLHGIQGNAHENQMTAFNLSVCIAPSMLWPPGAPCSPEVEGEETKKVCELVKFMIEHCQQILGEDPRSLFGGPPQRRHCDETGSDSSYDSLENELDNSSGGSPSFCSRLRSKPLQGSLDSILTSSDCDQDTGPGDHDQSRGLHGLERTRGRKQDSAAGGSSSTLDSLSPEGPHRPRRYSEPAIAYVAKFGPCASGSTEVLSGEEEDGAEDLSKETPSSHTHCTGESRRAGGECEACSSSLSSTTNSPAPTRSSLDSLDSLSSDRPGLLLPRTLLPSSSSSVTPPPFRLSSEQNTVPKASPPREALSWGTVKSSRGFHLNTWVKKGRRLSLSQQDNAEKQEDDDKTAGGGVPDKCERGGVKQKICRSRKDVKMKLDPEAHRPPSHHRSTGSLHLPVPAWSHCSDATQQTAEPQVTERKQSSSPSFFSQHRGPSLSLFKRRKSHSVEVERNARLHARRASEPGQRLVEQASALSHTQLPSDPGLKVSQVDSQGSASEARFCLSPHSTKAVRDYFSSHPRSNPQSSQQVALALVKSHREWLRRNSDPTAEPDYEQLLFAEESFV
uniref:rho GTPase-activating protein 20-like isoform X2 n=1 Tax=Solea senegalensis TaxID=28829 RepID=UPI001CD85B69|nr:rho GTPase-activating protein 20-like isoform X2 [Solea senegalensis]